MRATLCPTVDGLDTLERQSAVGDRERLAGVMSRDIYVTAVRTSFPGPTTVETLEA